MWRAAGRQVGRFWGGRQAGRFWGTSKFRREGWPPTYPLDPNPLPAPAPLDPNPVPAPAPLDPNPVPLCLLLPTASHGLRPPPARLSSRLREGQLIPGRRGAGGLLLPDNHGGRGLLPDQRPAAPQQHVGGCGGPGGPGTQVCGLALLAAQPAQPQPPYAAPQQVTAGVCVVGGGTGCSRRVCVGGGRL